MKKYKCLFWIVSETLMLSILFELNRFSLGGKCGIKI